MRLIRRFVPLIVVVTVVGALAVLLYGAYASVEWGDGADYLWLLIPAAGLVAGGYAWGRWKALLWLGTVPWVALALLSDVAWMTGVWDRSDEYEPLPTTPFLVIFGLPILIGLVAFGVAVRKTREAPRGAGGP
jgi:hypothetical protein